MDERKPAVGIHVRRVPQTGEGTHENPEAGLLRNKIFKEKKPLKRHVLLHLWSLISSH